MMLPIFLQCKLTCMFTDNIKEKLNKHNTQPFVLELHLWNWVVTDYKYLTGYHALSMDKYISDKAITFVN